MANKRKSNLPVTLTKKPQPEVDDSDWVIWAAWADRVTFEEIFERTGLREKDVIKAMRRELKPGSFRLWRKRVYGRTTKHRKIFTSKRSELLSKYPHSFKE